MSLEVCACEFVVALEELGPVAIAEGDSQRCRIDDVDEEDRGQLPRRVRNQSGLA